MDTEKKEINYNELLAMVADDTQPINIAALYQLSDMPTAQFDQFTNQWPQIDEIRRTQLARHLADISEENYQVDFTPFTTLFLADPADAVRLALFDILWDSTNLQLIPIIIKTMQEDKSTAVRAAATSTLGHYVLMMEWGEISDTKEDIIVTALLEQLRDDYAPLPIKRAALESVASTGTQEVHQFIAQAYQDSDKTLKLSAVFAMGRTADPRWLNNILQELDSGEPSMRIEASRAAGMLGKSEAVSQLIEIAKYDDDIEVQIAAVYALGEIGSDQASETLNEMAEEIDESDTPELADAIDAALEELDIFNFGDIDLALLDYNDEDDENY